MVWTANYRPRRLPPRRSLTTTCAAAAAYPDVYFHIISKDTGFDPLIKHLKAQRISCQRSAAVTDIPMIKVANAESVPERVDAQLDDLIKYKAAKPRTVERSGTASRPALPINCPTMRSRPCWTNSLTVVLSGRRRER